MISQYRHTKFIGRVDALKAVASLFSSGRRCVTLLGPGGIGKTRLAAEFLARTSAPSLWVDLSEVRSRDALQEAVASALNGFRQRPPDSFSAPQALTARRIQWLVLDNFEQLAAEALWVQTLLDETPGLCILVTSREHLRISAETLYELGPLDVSHDAVDLFVDRFLARTGMATLSEDDLTKAKRIAHALEGIPLALELVAQRAAVLGISTVHDGLKHQLELASGGTRDVSDRHRTLRRTLDSSWELLDEQEQRVLLACAVFRGGCRVPDVLAVCSDSPHALDVLQRLREKSLVYLDTEERIRLLEMIREHALERGPPTVRRELQYRHALQFSQTRIPLSPQWVVKEQENLTAVLNWLTEASDVPDRPLLAARILQMSGEVMLRSEQYVHLAQQVDAIFGMENAAELPAAVQAELWLMRSRAEERRGGAHAMKANWERAMELATASHNPTLTARLMRVRSLALARSGALDEALRLFDEASRVHDPLPSGTGAAADVLGLASALRQGLQIQAARALLERALAFIEDPLDRALLSLELGATYFEANLPDLAGDHLSKAEDVLGRAGWRSDQARALLLLGLAQHNAGQVDAAEQLLLQAIDVARQAGDWRNEGYALGYLAVVWMEQGKDDDAHRTLLRIRVPLDGHNALFKSYHAALLARKGELDAARMEWEEARRVTAPPILRDAIALQEVHLELAESWVAIGTGAQQKAEKHVATARRMLLAVENGHGEVQMALGLARLALQEHGSAQRERTNQVLWIHESGEWFRFGDAPAINCKRHGNAKRALSCLAKERLHQPGQPVGWKTLIARIWPEQQMLESAARNRLRVTMSSLRRAGLKEILHSDTQGYWLADDVAVRVVKGPLPK